MNEVLLSVCANGVTDNVITPRSFTWDEIKAAVAAPEVGTKDGAYFVRGGRLAPGANTRSDANLVAADVIVLDGDSRIDPETGEVLSGAPPMPEVCAALTKLGIQYVVHTTHSYIPGEAWRYRAIIPARITDPVSLASCVEWLIDRLHDQGVLLENVTENSRWSQPWYWPRVPTEEAKATYVYCAGDGEALPVGKALGEIAEKRRVEKAMHSEIRRPNLPQPRADNISEFNSGCDLAWVRATLEANDYQFSYAVKGTYRYLRPGSETGVAGVVVFKGARGDWCTYSHHGGADPLSGKLNDPFGLFAVFEHGGNVQAAARWLVQEKAKTALKKAPVLPSGPSPTLPPTADAAVVPVVEAVPTTVTHEKKPRISLIRASELKPSTAHWLINGLVPCDSFGVIYGKPGSYKSFTALYLAGMVASGGNVFDRTTIQSEVVYCAGEGRSGLHQRWAALRATHSLPDDTPLFFVDAQLDLRSTDDDMIALIEAVRARSVAPRLIIVDTVARAFGGGDENSAQDMSSFIDVCGTLQETFGATVIGVHHAGKDEARGMRGSSALLGAADVVMSVSRSVEVERGGALRVVKMKDGEDNVTHDFFMSLHRDPVDPNITSLALTPTTVAAAEDGEGVENEMLASLEMALRAHGRTVSEDEIEWGTKVVSEKSWKAAYLGATKASADNARRYFGRWKGRLVDTGKVRHFNGWYWR